MGRSFEERAIRPRAQRHRFALWYLFVVSLLGCAHAPTTAPPREVGAWGGAPAIGAPPTRREALPSIDPTPTPPAQHRRWDRSNEHDAPPGWLDATDALYGDGFGDPRDAEYRYVALDVGDASRAAGSVVYTEAFTFDALGAHWAVAWNGVVYPVVMFGPIASLDASARLPLRSAAREADAVRVETRTLLAIPLLVRLGRMADATALAAAQTGEDALVALERIWKDTLVAHAVGNRLRDRHDAAVRDLDRLVTLATRLTTAARQDPFFAIVPALRADEARRLGEGEARFDFGMLDGLDTPSRAAVLVSRLDAVGPGVSREAYVDALVRAGPSVIDGLVDAIDRDDRLTREIRIVGGPTRHYVIVTVADVAYDALVELLLVPTRHHPVNRWEDARGDRARRHAFAAQLRSYWDAAR